MKIYKNIKSFFQFKIFLLTLLFIGIKNQAQTIDVLDIDTNDPIPGVAIFNLDKSIYTYTDSNGQAIIDDFGDEELLIFQSLSYEKTEMTVNEIIDNDYVVYLEFKVEGLSEIIISANKFKQDKADIPQKIITFSAKEIALTNPQTSADLLQNTGQVFVQKSQLGGGSPMIRGFSTNRLLITVDNVRMNNAIFRGGNLQNVISIDPFSIQNTEVTLGAGSVVYGSDAIGGVMSFYSKKPQLSYKDSLYFKANAITRYSTAINEQTFHLDANFGFKKIAFLSSFSYSDFDDLRMGKHGPDRYLRPDFVSTTNGVDVIVQNSDPRIQNPTGYRQQNWMQKITYEPTDKINFELGIYFTKTSEYARYDRLLRRQNDGSLRSAEWNYGPQEWMMANLQITKQRSTSPFYDQLHTTIAFQRFQESRIDRDYQSPIRRIRSESVGVFSFNLDFEKKISNNSNINYGLEYLSNVVGSSARQENIQTNISEPTVTRYPDGATWKSFAAYTSYKYKPSEKFVFQSGLRYNHIFSQANFSDNNIFLNLPYDNTEITSGALTGTAGVSWSPNETVRWNLNTSTAFRAPNIDDIGKVFDSEPGAIVVPNNNLKAEYAYGAELGVTLNFDDKFIFEASTYYTFLDNALVRSDFSLNGNTQIIYDGELSNVQAIQNASKAWISGLEIGARYQFSENFKAKAQYSIVAGREDSNGVKVPVRHVAPNFGNLHLEYKTDRLFINAFLNYNAKLRNSQLAPSEVAKDFLYDLDENGNPFSPAWYTLNLRCNYKILENLDITATLENMTDQRYRPYSSGITAPGRNLILSLNYSL